MPKSPKKDLGTFVRQIAKKHNISLSLSKPVPAASGALGAGLGLLGGGLGPLGGARGLTISAPISKPCGKGVRGSDAYSRSELVKLAKASDIDPKGLDMDDLCAALGINPAVSEVQVPAKNCGTSYRGDDRYTRADVVALAKARGIKPTGKTMDELCSELGIEPARQPIAARIPLVLSPEARIPLVLSPEARALRLAQEKKDFKLPVDQMKQSLRRSEKIGALADKMTDKEVENIYNKTPYYFIYPSEDPVRMQKDVVNSRLLEQKLGDVRERIAGANTPWVRLPSMSSALPSASAPALAPALAPSAPQMYEDW